MVQYIFWVAVLYQINQMSYCDCLFVCFVFVTAAIDTSCRVNCQQFGYFASAAKDLVPTMLWADLPKPFPGVSLASEEVGNQL